MSTRKHFSKYAYLPKQVRRTYIDWGIVAKNPCRTLLSKGSVKIEMEEECAALLKCLSETEV